MERLLPSVAPRINLELPGKLESHTPVRRPLPEECGEKSDGIMWTGADVDSSVTGTAFRR